MAPDLLVVTTTVAEPGLADRLATGLVEARLATCVQVLGPMRSTYRWQGALERAEEWLLLVKTTRTQWEAVAGYVRAHHPYDVPELIATPVVAADPAYLDWLASNVGPVVETAAALARRTIRIGSGDVDAEVDRDTP